MEETRRLRSIWKMMKHRCYDQKYDKYHYYGGRGIEICKKWLKSFDEFLNWSLANGYKDSLTLDRKNNDGNYTPRNCRWTTIKEQANNRSTNHMLKYKGKTQSMQQWADELGLTESAISQRLRAGWSVNDALSKPLSKMNRYTEVTYKGQTKRLYEWAEELGMKYNTLQSRLTFRKWPVEKAFETPVQDYHYKNE